jgi:hypothetical protein
MEVDENTLLNACTDLLSLKKYEAFPLHLLLEKRTGEWTGAREFCQQIGVAANELTPDLFVSWLPDPKAHAGYVVIIFYDDESMWSMSAHYNRVRLLDSASSKQAMQATEAALSTTSGPTSGQAALGRELSHSASSGQNMTQVVPHVPLYFDLEPFAGRWFSWTEIAACFWPGKGRRATAVNPELAPVRKHGGVYLMAWSQQPPTRVHPRAPEVRYIGETHGFAGRMAGFANSAGFWGERRVGHSAAWRWPEGKSEYLWVAFFVVADELQSHLARGLRKWLEAVALEEYRLEHGRIPEVNVATEVVKFGKAEPTDRAERPTE